MKPSSACLPAFSAYGLELEYMLVDAETLDCMSIADQQLTDGAGRPVSEIPYGALAWSNEFFLHVIELKNPRPTRDFPTLEQALQSAVRDMNRKLHRRGACLMPGAMHPWLAPQDCRRWPHGDARIYDTYARVFDCNTHGWANLQSMHVNLPFADDAEFARLHAAVRLVLPLIPALAASSPIADGRATGFADFRLEAYRCNADAFPAIVGQVIPEPVVSEAEYRNRILAPMYGAIAAVDPGQVLQHEWLNSRGAIARFDRHAIEIRLVDVQECVKADLAVATAIIQVVRHLYRNRTDGAAAPHEFDAGALQSILLDCIRAGRDAVIEDATYLQALGIGATARRAAEVWRDLIDAITCEPLQTPVGWRQTIGFILEQGNLADRIMRALPSGFVRSDLREVYRELCRCLDEGHLFAGGPGSD